MKTLLLVASVVAVLGIAGCFIDLDDGPAEIEVLRESRPLGSAKELAVRLKYGVGRIEVTKTSGDNLFSLDAQYDRRRFNPTFNFDEGERATMRLDMNSRGGFNTGRGRDNELSLGLSDKVLLDMQISTGVSESVLDMTGLQVSRMDLEGGVGKTEVTFDSPMTTPMESFKVQSGVGEVTVRGLGNTRVGRIDVEGGVGQTELDFTGELGTANINCNVEVGVGHIRIQVPRDATVELQGEGSFLSNINAADFDRDGRTYTHRGDSGATIRIKVESGVGGVSVELI